MQTFCSRVANMGSLLCRFCFNKGNVQQNNNCICGDTHTYGADRVLTTR